MPNNRILVIAVAAFLTSTVSYARDRVNPPLTIEGMKPGVSFDGEKRIAGSPAVCSSNQVVTACRFNKSEFGKVKFAMRAKYTLDCDINMSFNEKGMKQYGMFCQAVDVDGTTLILDQHSMDDRYGIIMLASKNAWQKVSTEPIEARIRTQGE